LGWNRADSTCDKLNRATEEDKLLSLFSPFKCSPVAAANEVAVDALLCASWSRWWPSSWASCASQHLHEKAAADEQHGAPLPDDHGGCISR
jgi:hypothetical protein